ncbi:FadR/GntR family transcriptional regulator [Aquamicrobium zhengzhouense]|uniref:Pyruvate dehydrogenase complex repressor n=1 Tax=Aquamicrobium zhengzhouense TaxID=2781738 RepID=A0ABS0SCY5_9HYPH|nr:FCD domain-containing protein [Aquamicrobium zhengzhouense]MBI1621127.1 FCD domain-containing protein [Aquamicrobium zhengzhouense]
MNEIFSRIDPSRTADDVIDQVEMLILEGVVRPGDRLPGERELARQFDISRPIVRDALKELESRGLVITRPGGGTHVADVIGEVFTPPVMDLISQNRKAAADYLEYRREIEGVAAEFAARRATEDDLALLAGIMQRMEDANASGNFDDEVAMDVEFHNAVGECAHNIVLLHTLRSCYRLLADGVFLSRTLIYKTPATQEVLLAQHRAIYDAIAAGNPQAAREAARAHIDYVEKAMNEAERNGEWQRVSRLRLRQRSG